MLLATFMTLILVFTARAAMSWRTGIFLMILVAALQDPVRKLIPGTPGWLALATAPVLVATVLASARTTPHWWPAFRTQLRPIAKALVIFILLSIPAAVISASYGPGSWMLTVIGAFSYSVIFLAMLAGFYFARRLGDVRRMLAVYCVAHGVMLTGGIFEYLDWFREWTVIGDEALGYNWIRSQTGYVVEIISGFYRSGDVMGWHAAAVSILTLTLALSGRGLQRWLWLALTALAVTALLLCGRRKMVYMLPVFGLALMWIYWQAGRAAKVWSTFGLLALPAASVWFVGDWLGEEAGQVRYYTETSDETFDRLQTHGFLSLVDTYKQSGFFGEGLGTATPGSHHLQVARPRIWQESGPSRILVELGVPGALGFLGVVIAIVLSLWRVTKYHLRSHSPCGLYAAGLVAFFLANAGSLTVSGQILADPFIASFLGFMVGIVLSFARAPFLVPAQTATPAPPPRPMRAAGVMPRG
jgi:hypothetical protein